MQKIVSLLVCLTAQTLEKLKPLFWVGGFLLCLAYLPAQAQNKKVIDSLMRVYNIAKHDTSKILALKDIAYEYANSKPDTCIILSEKALQMSEKIGFQKGTAWAWNRMGMGCCNACVK